MNILQRELDRRRLLKYLGFSALALSLQRVLLEEQLFGATPAKRALFFYYPDGMIKDRWHPAATGNAFDLPEMTAPLNTVKDQIIMLKGVDYKTEGSHEGGAAYSLSGVKGQRGAVTIDTYLGEKLKANTSLPVARLGVASNFQQGQPISYFAQGSASAIEDNPTRAFYNIFGGAAKPMDTGSQAKVLNAEKSILDFCMDDIASLQKKLGTVEQRKLDTHLQSLRELERRVQGSSSGASGMASASCNKQVDMRGQNFPMQDSNYPQAIHKNELFAVVGDIMIDMMVQVFACGVSNVGYMQWSHPVSPTAFNFPGGIGVGRAHHDISHYGDANGSGGKDFVKAQQWYTTRLAKLIKGLSEIKEGDQSVLYNTAMLSFSEIADANLHDFSNVGLVLAGQAGGAWKTGRCLDASGSSHNKVLVSMLQACGLGDNTFGDPGLGQGPLSGLGG